MARPLKLEILREDGLFRACTVLRFSISIALVSPYCRVVSRLKRPLMKRSEGRGSRRCQNRKERASFRDQRTRGIEFYSFGRLPRAKLLRSSTCDGNVRRGNETDFRAEAEYHGLTRLRSGGKERKIELTVTQGKLLFLVARTANCEETASHNRINITSREFSRKKTRTYNRSVFAHSSSLRSTYHPSLSLSLSMACRLLISRDAVGPRTSRGG